VKSPSGNWEVANAPPPDPSVSAEQYIVYDMLFSSVTTVLLVQTAPEGAGMVEDVLETDPEVTVLLLVRDVPDSALE